VPKLGVVRTLHCTALHCTVRTHVHPSTARSDTLSAGGVTPSTSPSCWSQSCSFSSHSRLQRVKLPPTHAPCQPTVPRTGTRPSVSDSVAHNLREVLSSSMADKTAALRGGAADAPPPSARLTTPAWLDQRDARPDANKARTAQVKRYFPGQAPQWQQQAHSSAAEGGGGQGDHASGWRADDGFGNRGAAPMHREVRPPEIVALPPRQATAATHIVDDDAVVAVEEEDEEAYARRRAAARARCVHSLSYTFRVCSLAH